MSSHKCTEAPLEFDEKEGSRMTWIPGLTERQQSETWDSSSYTSTCIGKKTPLYSKCTVLFMHSQTLFVQRKRYESQKFWRFETLLIIKIYRLQFWKGCWKYEILWSDRQLQFHHINMISGLTWELKSDLATQKNVDMIQSDYLSGIWGMI